MAILVDFNQIMIANMFAELGNTSGSDVDPELLRHMFLNKIRSVRNKFYDQYGEIVICADSKMSWRRQEFEYYKAARKKNRDESGLDWKMIHQSMDDVFNEINQFFPYKALKFDHVEADDIIGTICHLNGAIMDDGSEKLMILSSDKDYIQLQQYANVSQYNPIRKEWVIHSNPKRYLAEHILKGDRGDGIPNILSQDNCFMVGVRQKPMTKKKIEAFIDNPSSMDTDTIIKFKRNRKLIDLSCVPMEYQAQIIEKYNTPKDVDRRGLFDYFIKNGLHNLLEHVGEF